MKEQRKTKENFLNRQINKCRQRTSETHRKGKKERRSFYLVSSSQSFTVLRVLIITGKIHLSESHISWPIQPSVFEVQNSIHFRSEDTKPFLGVSIVNIFGYFFHKSYSKLNGLSNDSTFDTVRSLLIILDFSIFI